MPGTIGGTLINKLRSEMGLTGNLRATSKPKAAAGKRAKPATTSPGKTMFVKEFLIDNREGNVRAVNEAWTAAGFGGSISSTLVNKMRAKLGLAGNLRRRTKTSKAAPAAKKAEAHRATAAPVANGSMTVNDLEADIDRLIFKAMVIGNLAEIENALRRARRLLYVNVS